MSEQYDFGTINPATKSGTALATDLNEWRDAVHASHRGPTRPPYARGGMLWVKEVSASAWEVYLFDGTNDILFATFNPTNDTWDIGTVRDGGIPVAALVQGAGSGLDADKLDGLQATAFRQTGQDLSVVQNTTLKFSYQTTLNADDGKIGARLFGAGLNIVGIASEGNGIRYLRTWGDWINYGSLLVSSTSGLSVSGGPLVVQNNHRVEAQGEYPKFVWHRPGFYAWTQNTEPTVNEMQWTAGTTQQGSNGAVAMSLRPGGTLWTRAYGDLDVRFAHRGTELEMGPSRVTGNCGPNSKSSGYEVYDRGDGVHRIRVYVNNCTDCTPINCNCQCGGEGS